MKKKFKMVIFALLIALLIPTTAFADVDTQKYRGSFPLDSTTCRSLSFSSTGGLLHVSGSDIQSGNRWRIHLYESDGTGNEDYIRSTTMYGNMSVYMDVSGLVDGSDNDAEIRLCIGNATTAELAFLEVTD